MSSTAAAAQSTTPISVQTSNQTNITDVNKAESNAAPALAAYNNRLYMAYKGASTDNLYACYFNGSTWQAQTRITDQNSAESNATPALAVYNNRLYMAYKGKSSNNLYACYFDGSTWQAQTRITDQNDAQSNASPALAVYNNRLYMAYKGASTDKLYCCSFDGNTWGSQSSITTANGAESGSGPALAAFNGRLYMAYGGKNSTGYTGTDLYVCSFDGTNWSGQTNLEKVNGAEEYLSPAMAALGNTLFIIYRGAHTAAIWGCAFNGSSWSDQVEFSKIVSGSPGTATSPGLGTFQNQFYTAYTGIGLSTNLWEFSFTVEF